MTVVETTLPSALTRACLLLALALAPAQVLAQHAPSLEPVVDRAAAVSQTPPLSAAAYVPITGLQRVDWIIDGTIGRRSLGVGVLADVWQTGFNVPEEWGRTWSGVGKRYLEREADVAISSTIEAGAGALWGEDPRYVPSGRRGLWPRARYALKTVQIGRAHV